MDPRLQKVFDLLPNKCPSVFIAGGAAVDYDRAGDVDVFFCKNNLPAALKFINDNGGTVLDKPNPYGKNTSFLVGEIKDKVDKTIQVVVSTYATAHETVDDFDISTHMLGYLSTGNKVVGTHYTDLKTPPKVLNVKDKTVSRYYKICDRYGFELDESVLEYIHKQTQLMAILDII